jgi:hypothetical protein
MPYKGVAVPNGNEPTRLAVLVLVLLLGDSPSRLGGKAATRDLCPIDRDWPHFLNRRSTKHHDNASMIHLKIHPQTMIWKIPVAFIWPPAPFRAPDWAVLPAVTLKGAIK